MLDALPLFGSGAVLGAAAVEALRVRKLVRSLRQVALCSHELRGALTAIDLALTRIERTPGAAGAVRAETLRHAYDRAVSVARDLEAARGALPAHGAPRPELVDLRDVVRRVVETWNASLHIGGGSISLDWRGGAALLHGYPMRLAQALDNLVANAVEHGRGPVSVVGRTDTSSISVCVLDRGAGLMRPLDQLRPGSWHARRGHGLVVARHAVELHGGTLRTVRGPSGSGIEMRLPAGDATTPVCTQRGRGLPRPSGSRAATP